MTGLDEDWKPPARTMPSGAIIFDNWQAVRASIDAAYTALGRDRPDNIPTEVWNLVGLAIDHRAHAMRATCSTCGRRLWPHQTIRCYDCRAALCEACAPKHLWPKGRPR